MPKMTVINNVCALRSPSCRMASGVFYEARYFFLKNCQTTRTLAESMAVDMGCGMTIAKGDYAWSSMRRIRSSSVRPALTLENVDES